MTQNPPSGTERRVALVANTDFYIGPPLARLLATKGHDLVIGDPEPGLVEELEGYGAAVEVVTDVKDLRDPEASERLVAEGLARFGRIDAACAFSGRVVTGRFLKSTIEDLRTVVAGCLESPYHFMKAVVPPMVERGDGQVLIVTSASGARPTPGAPLYSAARAGANHLVRNVADEVARNGVQVNAVGTNFMDFPEFLRATGGTDPAVRAQLEAAVPLRRLGTVEECAAFCTVFLDGTSRFTTGQFVSYAGGWA
jgi:NAD(P)-dependent dehydrogenase (short-subunit alcohol dehydrogenase family)